MSSKKQPSPFLQKDDGTVNGASSSSLYPEIAELQTFIEQTESLAAAALASMLIRELPRPSHEAKTPVLKFPFGKFKGAAPDNVPTWYLLGALAGKAGRVDDLLRTKIERVLSMRKMGGAR